MVFALRSSNSFKQARAPPGSAMVVGSGGTTRAAVYALHSLRYSPIYIVARNTDHVRNLADSFPPDYNIQHLENSEQASSVSGSLPSVLITTIPADRPVDPGTKEIVMTILRHPKAPASDKSRVLLEMAYMPRHTPLMQLAEDAGWHTIPGLEVLSAQGWYQVRPVFLSFSVLGDNTYPSFFFLFFSPHHQS